MCGTDWAPSMSTQAPARCAISTIVVHRGDRAQRVRDLGDGDQFRLRSEQQPGHSSSSSWPVSSTGMTRSFAPVSAHNCCQGTMFAWCSRCEMTISSPAWMLALPQLLATRLIASVAPRTKTMFFSRLGAQEPGDGLAGPLVGVGGPGRELVRGAVDVGVLVPVEVREPVDDGLRLLGRRGVVEPDQLLPVDPFGQDREVPADQPHVERRVRVAPAPPSAGGRAADGAAGRLGHRRDPVGEVVQR